MEAGTAPTPTTGSKTIADLLTLAAEKYGDRPMVRYKAGDEWKDVSFTEAGAIASEISRGLLGLGLEKGERVSLLSDTRPEWTYCSLAISAAGGVVVPIYPTNSPEECEWVAGNSESVGIVCSDATQIAKIRQVQGNLPHLKWIVVIDGDGDIGDAIVLDDLRAQGRERDVAELEARRASIGPDDGYTFIYTSGTTGPPKGCVLLHRNYRSVLDMINERGLLGADGDLVYLFLPLAHAFALLIQLGAVDTGTTVAYFGGDPKQIIPELMQVKPTYLPSVPRIFEKLFTLAQGQIPAPVIAAISEVGGRIRDLEVAGEPVPAELEQQWTAPLPGDEQGRSLASIAQFVQGLFGGNLREAVTGAAPIAPEILRFFWGAGVPVMEGYGMTETATVSTTSTPEHHKFGSVGRPLPGVEVKIADDGEILIKGANIFHGYYKNDDASFGAIVDGWLHTGDVGKVDEDGFVFITGRKKDIIITAGGKNLTPANLENDMKQTRWVSQAVMHGDRRPFPVMLITLDEEEIVPWAQQNGIEDTSISALAQNEQVHALIQAELDKANEKYAQVEQVKKFFILDHDLSQETGELTPTLKVKRNIVNEKYAGRFDALYEG
jgi:long-chain acyl-CoA synthetase